MNIGIVVPYFTPYVRGNEYGLAQSLAALGHNVTIITSTARAPREKAVTNVAQRDGFTCNFDVKYFTILINIVNNPVVTGIKNHIKDQDVVMLQEDYPLICHRAYSAAREYGIPTVLSSERTYYPENIIKRYTLRVLDATTNKKLRNNVDVLTAHCTAAREFMMNELGVKREIKVIHVGVDTDMFRSMQPAVEYLVKGDFKILTVARLHRYKGLRFLIEAMKIIGEEVPDAHLYIMGKGEEEQNLKSIADKLQLNSSITFLNTPVPNHEMPQVYAGCDVYVQPSIIEPYGIAVLEAMACGKPVIGTNVGGMKDTIVDRVTGYLVPPKNPNELADAMLDLSRQELRREIGLKARERAVEQFDWKLIAAEYEKIIEN